MLLTFLPPGTPPQGFLKPPAGGLHLSLAANAWLLIASAPANVGEDARLLALLLKAFEGLFKGLPLLNANTRHLAFTPLCLQELITFPRKGTSRLAGRGWNRHLENPRRDNRRGSGLSDTRPLPH